MERFGREREGGCGRLEEMRWRDWGVKGRSCVAGWRRQGGETWEGERGKCVAGWRGREIGDGKVHIHLNYV